jgi:hypothetical protein
MSLSKEGQEYHLTSRGWLAGSFYGDLLGGQEIRKTPKDRVLTVVCYDVLPSAFSEPYFYESVAWKSKDKRRRIELKKKFGRRPDWFGYERM